MISAGVILSVLVGLVIFLFGLENFSSEIKKIAGEQFSKLLQKAVSNRFVATLSGFLVTAILQSSAATTLIAVSLINAGIISFGQSLGIIFGSNIGSTITAQLVALKLTSFAPYFVITGFLLGVFGGKFKYIGKGLFYFGLVFFGLSLMSQAVTPIKDDPAVINYFLNLSNIYLAILAGFLLTALTNSSAVVIGIVIVFAGAGLIPLSHGIPILLGANLGTTMTTLIASFRLNLYAKRTAVAHLLFNIFGVLLILPFLNLYTNFIISLGGSVEQQIANAHTIFNIINAGIFLILLNPFKKVVELIVRGKEEEILLKPKYITEKLSESNATCFKTAEKEISYSMGISFKMFQLSKELLREQTPRKIDMLERLGLLTNKLNGSINDYLFKLSERKLTHKEAKKILYLIRMSNALEQLGDIAEEFGELPEKMREKRVYFAPNSIKGIDEVYKKFEEAFEELKKAFPDKDPIHAKRITERNSIEPLINRKYNENIPLLREEFQYSGSIFAETISLIENSISKIREVIILSQLYYKN